MAAKSLAPLVGHIRQLAGESALRALNDGELLQRFIAGKDRAAFAALVRRHGRPVLAACRQVLSDPADAEDAFQATFLTLLLRADSIHKKESVGSWLFGTAHRIAVRARANARRRRQREAAAAAARERAETPDVSWREAAGVLHEELDRLPDRYRQPLLLCYLQGKSRDEAAEQLGWTPGSLKWRLERGREALRKRLARRGITLGAALLGALGNSWAACALPPRLVQATLQAATAGPVPAAVAALTGGVSAVLGSKVKLTIAFVLCLGLLTGIAAHRAPAPLSASPPPDKPLPAGELARLRPAQPRAEEGESAGESAEKVRVHGRVLGPDGEPVPGAKVYVSSYTYKDKTVPGVRATTDADGRFRFTAKKTEVDHNEAVTAVAEGHGLDWLELHKVDPDKEVTLRLVKDLPITGRVLDLEGRPVAGATVRVLSLWRAPGEDLTELLKDLQADPNDRNTVGRAWIKHQGKMSRVAGVIGTPRSVRTGADGRFRLAGFGRERVVSLRVEGDTIEHTFLQVLIRPGLTGLPPRVHGAAFEHVAGPTKPIRGVVRDKRTGKPVASVWVNGQPALENGFGDGVNTRTDEEGRFTLLGLPKANKYHLGAGGVPYITGRKEEVADTPGLEPIRVDFELERALGLRVRVTDKNTGRPVRAYVQYEVRRDNPGLDDYPSYPRNAHGWNVNDKDGWSEHTVLPGPGLIAVQAIEGEFSRARLKDKHGDSRIVENVLLAFLALDKYHAVVPTHPDEKDPKSLVLEIALDPGRSVSGTVVGPDGEPLGGVMVAGLTAVTKAADFGTTDKLADSAFTARGLEPDHPRTLLFFHEEKQLARAVTLRGDERGPVTVKLEPLGAVTGRLVDPDGKPVAGAEVRLPPGRSVRPTLPGELVIHGLGTLLDRVSFSGRQPLVKTDEQGRYRLRGLIPGMKYDLLTPRGGRQGGNRLIDLVSDRGDLGYVNLLGRELSPVPGKEVDLGNLKRKPAPGGGEKE